MGVVVNVCPSGVSAAAAERVWQVLTTPERFDEWLDAQVVAIYRPGPAHRGQRIELAAAAFGHRFQISIDIAGVDPAQHWIELRVQLPFGIVNHERVTLTEVEVDRTLVRFN